METVGLVLPTRNRFNWLKRTLTSLERQTYKEFKIYVSDDGSTDETKEHDASLFPNLNIHWIRREPASGNIIKHFNALYNEAKEDWIGMVHDDEVYEASWLETLVGLIKASHSSGKVPVMAFTGVMIVDARFQKYDYYSRKNNFPSGIYSAEELKKLFVFSGYSFIGNGFIVSRSAVSATGPIKEEYEQFDYEWMMRIAGQGSTVVSNKLLHTRTVHASNTIGSQRYIELYLKQYHSTEMLTEWLQSLTEISSIEKKKKRDALLREKANANFKMYLKSIACCDRKLCSDFYKILARNPLIFSPQKVIAFILCQPFLFTLSSYLIKKLINIRKRNSLMKNNSLSRLKKEDLPKSFLMLLENEMEK